MSLLIMSDIWFKSNGAFEIREYRSGKIAGQKRIYIQGI